MRERLIELLKQNCESTAVDNGEFIEITINWEELADALLAEGVIVPPVKVGDTVWYPSRYYNKPYPIVIEYMVVYEEETVLFSSSDSEWHYEDFGKTVFLTKEEAEQALAERSKR